METNHLADLRDGITAQTWHEGEGWVTIELDLDDMSPGANDDMTADDRIDMAIYAAEQATAATLDADGLSCRLIVDGVLVEEWGINGRGHGEFSSTCHKMTADDHCWCERCEADR